MQRRLLIVVVLLAVVGVGAILWMKSRRPLPPPVSDRAAATPTPTPAAVPRPTTVPAPAPASVAPARRAPKPPPPSPSATPAATAAPDTATLHITSDVPGAQIFIDRQFIGATPVTADNIKPGIHQLNASVEGFDGVVESLDVEPGPRDVAVRFREVRLDAMLAVVHKHRFGSCTGQLHATPRELRYDTSNKDDAFSVPLADVTSMDVDYLQKNLRVKLRNGKTYNFTDPDGNADRLFVFQRDVDKVRQRLARGDQPAN